MVRLVAFSCLFMTSVLVGCDDAENLYMFDATVIDKSYVASSSEPLHVRFRVALNGHPKQIVTCRIKNVLKPMWEGLYPGKDIKLTKTSSFDYTPKMLCGLLNDANIRDVLK